MIEAVQGVGFAECLRYIYNTDRTHLNAVLDFATGDAAPKGVPAAANPAYVYDPNGNLILDQAKNMKIKYNHLNLPRQVEAQGYNDYGSGTIRFTYDASGRKLKKSSSGNDGGTTLYADGVEKENGHTFVYHADGRAAYYVPDPNLNPQPEPECIDWRYEWAMRDHLGNTRLTLADLDCDGYIHAVDGDWSAQPVGLATPKFCRRTTTMPSG